MKLLSNIFVVTCALIAGAAQAGDWKVTKKQGFSSAYLAADYLSDKYEAGETVSASLWRHVGSPKMVLEAAPKQGDARTAFFARYADVFDEQIGHVFSSSAQAASYCRGSGDRAVYGECLYKIGREQSILGVSMRFQSPTDQPHQWNDAHSVVYNFSEDQVYHPASLAKQTPPVVFSQGNGDVKTPATSQTRCYTNRTVARSGDYDSSATCPVQNGALVTGADGYVEISLALIDKFDSYFEAFAVRFSTAEKEHVIYVPRKDVVGLLSAANMIFQDD